MRIPGWAEQATVLVNDAATGEAKPGTYVVLERVWQAGDLITLQLPMPPKLHRQINRNVQESRAPDGASVSQEVLHFDYAAITRGPLVYSTGLIDGFKMEETIRLPPDPTAALELLDTPAGGEAAAVRLNLGYRPALIFQPYFEAGGRTDGTWRLTWLQITPE